MTTEKPELLSNAPMSVEELRRYAQALSKEAFVAQVGPFVLVQSPPTAMVQKMARLLGARATFSREGDIRAKGMASMISKFESLAVATLPPIRNDDSLNVGRLPDCELVVDDPSVSRRHAVVRWDENLEQCSVQDLDSRNGTWLNGSSARDQAMVLTDGDLVSFGDATFLYFRTAALYLRLLGTDDAFEVISVQDDVGDKFELVAIADPSF